MLHEQLRDIPPNFKNLIKFEYIIMDIEAIIVSDIHLGSRYCLDQEFLNFFDRIPDGTDVIFNGDTIDDPQSKLPKKHQRVLDRIIQASERLNIIWIYGNHDSDYLLSSGNIQYKTFYHLGNRLAVLHGHNFDTVMPYSRSFIYTFHLLHDLRIRLGCSPVHVAHYAKKWKYLYRHLCRSVTKKAVAYCKQHKFPAITCGHVHYPEDITIDGVQYINTGSWTEEKGHYIVISKEDIILGNTQQMSLFFT